MFNRFNRYGRQNIYLAVSGLLNLGLGIALCVSDKPTGAKVHALRVGIAIITFINYQLIKYNIKYSPSDSFSVLGQPDAAFERVQKGIKCVGRVSPGVAVYDIAMGIATEAVNDFKDPSIAYYAPLQKFLDGLNTVFSLVSSAFAFGSNRNRHLVEEAIKNQHDTGFGMVPTDNEVQETIASGVHDSGVQAGCFDRAFRRMGI